MHESHLTEIQRSNFSLKVIAPNYPRWSSSSLSEDTRCQLWHHSQLQCPRQGIRPNGSAGPAVGQHLWHFTMGMKQTTQQHTNRDTHTKMIQQDAMVRGLEEPLTVDMVYPANTSLNFIQHSCLSYVTKTIMKNLVLWYLTLKFVLPHCHQPAT